MKAITAAISVAIKMYLGKHDAYSTELLSSVLKRCGSFLL